MGGFVFDWVRRALRTAPESAFERVSVLDDAPPPPPRRPIPRIPCGAVVGSPGWESICMVPAPCPMHSPTAADVERAETERLLNEATRDPVPGLYAMVSNGEALPRFAELRARYGDPANLPPFPPSAVETADHIRPLREWEPEYKLRHALGRPSLAKRLVDELPRDTAVELADVVEALFERRLAAVQVAVNEVTEEALARMHEDARRKLEEVRRERFKPSRLG